FPNTLTKLTLYVENYRMPLSFITKFTKLQELQLSQLLYDHYHDPFEDFKIFQYAVFPQLQILRIPYSCPKYELLINFIEINGKNLRELYIDDDDSCSTNSLNLAIAKFCPNLKTLSVGFKHDDLETLKIVFNSCHYLESINIWCGGDFLNEKDALEMVAKYSPRNFRELNLVYIRSLQSKLSPEELESFFVSWERR